MAFAARIKTVSYFFFLSPGPLVVFEALINVATGFDAFSGLGVQGFTLNIYIYIHMSQTFIYIYMFVYLFRYMYVHMHVRISFLLTRT